MSESSGGEAQGGISNQLATLVPSFDPSKDELQMYQQKVQLVLSVWPSNRISELVTRLILNTTGSAFAKLQIHHAELCNDEAKSVQKLIEYLGGQWGKTGLEKRYYDAERALFHCNQQSDESHDSYLARADVLWSKLKSQKLQLEDLQAYITLRGAQLSGEDKKRIILDSDSSLEGSLTVGRVQEAVRMLGTAFFHEMTGQGKKTSKSKVYDASTFIADDMEGNTETEDHIHMSQHDEWTEDDMLEALLAEGDDDAVFIADFETAASEVTQSDDDLAAAYSTYVEARRKLSEKFRSRGFWPIGKGKSRHGKGKAKGKSGWSGRKSLQQRILESNCRLCGKKGHWRNECPNKPQGTASATASAAMTVSFGDTPASSDQAMPAEFLLLPEIPSTSAKDILSTEPPCVQSVFFMTGSENTPKPHVPENNMREIREKIRNHIKGNKGTNLGVKALVHRIEQKLRHQQPRSQLASSNESARQRILRFCRGHEPSRDQPNVTTCSKAAGLPVFPTPVESLNAPEIPDSAEALFATHETWGILDTGATKTVMGSNYIQSFLNHLNPEIRQHVKRCSCEVLFRFGNQGALKATHAIVVPVCGMWLKIAIVSGATPFLVSNTLLRAIGAMIDTDNHQLIIPKFQAQVPLELTNKGLYLINMNQLFALAPVPGSTETAAETYAQETLDRDQKGGSENQTRCQSQPPFEEPTGSKVTGQTDQPSHAKPPSVSLSYKLQPVTHTSLPAESELPKFFTQSTRSSISEKVEFDHHEQLEPSPVQSPSKLCPGIRSGATRATEPDRTQSHAQELWKGPHGQNVPGDLGQRSTMDQMVPEPLCSQHKDRTPKDDPVHPAHDRGVRERDSTALSQGIAQSLSSSSKEPWQPQQCSCLCRRSPRWSLSK